MSEVQNETLSPLIDFIATIVFQPPLEGKLTEIFPDAGVPLRDPDDDPPDDDPPDVGEEPSINPLKILVARSTSKQDNDDELLREVIKNVRV